MLAYAQTPETVNVDKFWQLGAGDYFSMFGVIIGAAAVVIAILIYNEQRKLQKSIRDQERAHVVNALKLTHTLIADTRSAHNRFVTLSIKRTGENNPDLAELRRFMRDEHPIISKKADRIERALDPVRLYLPVELNTKLTSTTDYFRTLANPAENKYELEITDAAITWFSRRREHVKELDDLLNEIRKFAPEIPAPTG